MKLLALRTHAIFAQKGLLIKPQWNFTMQCMYAYKHICIKYYMEKGLPLIAYNVP